MSFYENIETSQIAEEEETKEEIKNLEKSKTNFELNQEQLQNIHRRIEKEIEKFQKPDESVGRKIKKGALKILTWLAFLGLGGLSFLLLPLKWSKEIFENLTKAKI